MTQASLRMRGIVLLSAWIGLVPSFAAPALPLQQGQTTFSERPAEKRSLEKSSPSSFGVKSPNGKCRFHLSVEADELTFGVSYGRKDVIRDSPLGLVLADGSELGPGMRLGEYSVTTVDTSYEPVYGTEKVVRDHHRILEVHLADPADPGRRLVLEARAYNDGVAFRYRVPGDGEALDIRDERTAYRLVSDATAFALKVRGFGTAYEEEYTIGPLSRLGSTLIGMPLLFELSDGPWLALTEANLVRYAGQFLRSATEEPLLLGTRLAPSRKKDGIAVHGTRPLATPWRVLLLGDRPGALIESNLVLNCNDPCAIEDPSWIVPGKCIWDWWNDRMVSGVAFDGGINTETMLHYAEFAAEAGFEYLLIDDGWSRGTILEPIPELDLARVLDFCRDHGVRVLLWLSWGRCNQEMHKAFPLYEKWGVAGVKIDYMNADHEDMVDFYHRATQLAAKHRLIVNFHGAYKPTGEQRTWPNLVTREAVRGEEHNKWDTVTATHNVTIPFTRMLAGPMDYTPGGFDNWHLADWKSRGTAPRVLGTRAHNLAKYVVYESPLQMCIDYPANYRGQPGFDFLRLVPTTWLATRVLDGYPGQFIVVARQAQDAWYLGVMLGDGPARTVEVPLDFLGRGAFHARVWEDGARAAVVATQLRIYEQTVTARDVLRLPVVSGGGAVARFVPVSEPKAGETRAVEP